MVGAERRLRLDARDHADQRPGRAELRPLAAGGAGMEVSWPTSISARWKARSARFRAGCWCRRGWPRRRGRLLAEAGLGDWLIDADDASAASRDDRGRVPRRQARIEQPAKGFRAGLDAVLLAAAVRCGRAREARARCRRGRRHGRAVRCRAAPVARVTLVEIAPQLAALARRNIERNGLAPASM